LNHPHRDFEPADRRARSRHRRSPDGDRRRHIPLTPEGVPAASPDAPPPSPVVAVSSESRTRYPWLPARVIAGSVWRGPAQERVRVDDAGRAAPWRTAVR